jgi:hypothetical protein
MISQILEMVNPPGTYTAILPPCQAEYLAGGHVVQLFLDRIIAER